MLLVTLSLFQERNAGLAAVLARQTLPAQKHAAGCRFLNATYPSITTVEKSAQAARRQY